MSAPGSRRFLVTEVTPQRSRRVPDELVVEEPLTITIGATSVATTMRTPGHDFELAAGFCFSEGLIGSPPTSMRYCGGATSAGDTDFNRVDIVAEPGHTTISARSGVTSSSCGWCGSDHIDELLRRIAPLPPTAPIEASAIAAVVDSVGALQPTFQCTGASHAAASFDPDGTVTIVREDVGRHNAVDKVVGARLLEGSLPATGQGLFVSGRASTELVQKAWAAGFSTLVAVSAPTALAVEAARRAGLCLIGFARGERMKVYAPERPQHRLSQTPDRLSQTPDRP